MDVDKLKAILDALQGTEVSRLDWTDGTQRLTIRLGHPPAPTTSVHALPMSAGMPAQMGIPTPASVTPTPFASVPVANPTPASSSSAQPPAAVADNTFTV